MKTTIVWQDTRTQKDQTYWETYNTHVLSLKQTIAQRYINIVIIVFSV